MKYLKYCLILFILLKTFQNSYAQNQDSLIQLYPGMGDTITYIDRAYFGLYSQIEGFKNAVIYIRNQNELVSKINYEEDGVQKDTVLLNDLSVLESTREKIELLLQEYDQKLTEPYDVELRTYNGNKHWGILEGFNEKYLYLQSDKNFLTGESGEFKFKISTLDVDEIVIKGKSDYLTPILWGSGIGFVTGFLAPIGFGGLVSESLDEEYNPEIKITGEWVAFAFVFAMLGAAIGAGIGWLSADDDETIRFKTDQSVIRLKEYARYHFKQDKPFYEYYYEINE